MPLSPVKIIAATNAALHHLRESTNALHDEIRTRAFDLFLQKGCQEGRELEDWLAAEQEVLCVPPAELAETKDEIHIQIATPGWDAHTLQVDVLPHSITIEGKAGKKVAPKDELIHFSEFGVKRLFRQFDLPGCIDPDSTTATVDRGILRIVARKAVAALPIIAEINLTKHAAA